MRQTGTLSNGTGPASYIINAPKGVVNNQAWAEQVYKYCLTHNIPAMIVRPVETSVEFVERVVGDKI